VIVPSRVGRFFFVTGLTGGLSALALARTALGDDDAVRELSGVWADRVARGVGMEVTAFGTEGLDPSEPHVFMCNHQSHMDIVALFQGLPLSPGFLAKRELRDVPLFGRAMDAGGHVFVDRQNREDAFRAIEKAAAQVAAGKSLVVFPEGTRSAPGTVKRFKKGGFHLAKQARVPIVPVGIRGTAAVLPKHSRGLRPGAVSLHLGEPLRVDVIEQLEVDELVREVRVRIAELAGMELVDER
jgi:1-acyl-sn-glycerol-3-phosphate acyltransferase